MVQVIFEIGVDVIGIFLVFIGVCEVENRRVFEDLIN